MKGKPVRGPAPTLNDRQFEVLLVLCEKGPYPARDQAIIYLSFKTGLRAKEIAGLTLADLLDGEGHLKEEIGLRPEITKGKKYGTIYLFNPKARKALNAWIKQRRAQVTSLDVPLFVNRWGQPFNGNTMQKLMKGMYQRAGFPGSSHSGRRTFAARIEEHDPSLKTVQCLILKRALNPVRRGQVTSTVASIGARGGT
jgi:integrase/recombinase XerD